MHAVKKKSSSTNKIRAVFDAIKSSSGTSLNDMLLVGPTVHPPLIDVLLHFMLHRIALTADISKMCRAMELADWDHYLPLLDYRMARLTFSVSASAYASVKQNALDLTLEYPQAAKVVGAVLLCGRLFAWC